MKRTTTLLMVLGLLGSTASAQEVPVDRWTPELSMQYLAVQGTALSPDGGRVAYVVRTPLMEGEQSEYLSHIWVANTTGDDPPIQFTRGDKSAGSPAFSPDGRSLAFSTARSDTNQVWVISLAGGEARQVTKAKVGVGQFKWSPDGSRLAYLMTDPLTEEEELAKREKRDVILVDQNFKHAHLYVIDVDGTEDATRLTQGNFHITGFDWSPDGRTVAFSHQADPRINSGRQNGDISSVNASGGNVMPLVTTGGVETGPRYSPDGQWIAFTSTGDQPEAVGLGDIFVVAAAGGRARKLGDTHDRSGGLLGWNGDGTAVMYSESMGTTRQVRTLPLDGGAPSSVSNVDGVIGSVSFSADAELMAFTYQDTDTPADVFVSSTGMFGLNKVTDLHAEVPRPTMGRTELLRWRSQDGKFEIEGLLTYPVDYQPGRRYPLVLNVHGGPAGVFSQSFTGNPGIYMIQTFAQEGFAVLRPNPRGSTGYGKEFRYANVRDWGFGDMDDLMAGVDQVLEMGIAHQDSLLLMGWSYGGYMTSFAVTRTDRFRAASMGAGLPNLISMVTTTDIQDYLAAHLGAEFWDDYEAYERHSAIYRIGNVTTPTQVIHGAEDLRVPFTQGQEFYRALDRRGVPTEMVVYPRTPHGPREPKLLMDVTPRILNWFNRHLRKPAATTGGA